MGRAHVLVGRRSRRWIVCVGLLTVVGVGCAQAEDKPFSISLKGNFTTAAQLFPQPSSSDEVLRAQFFSLKNIWGVSAELRYRFLETDLAVALSVDYLRTTRTSSIRLSGNRQIPVEDGYRVVPVEVTGYFFIPLSSDPFGVYMGGGVGAYVGRRLYSIGGVEAPVVDRTIGFGIHVLSGVSYRVTEMISVVGEMKFRDVQFTSINKFDTPTIQYGTIVLPVSMEPFDSRVHTDGIIFQLGIVVAF